TQNRQDGVRELASQCDIVLVIGSRNSSNSNRLRELAEREGVRAYLIDGPNEIDANWLQGVGKIGLTAGASAPEQLVREVIAHLQSLGGTSLRELHAEPEDIAFALPKELRAEEPPRVARGTGGS
ncbi:MAG TPA: 4-hydroxy-3-methylbut-2-enyl diphosphate reductase, partial [Rhodanobacteraceae bacterium]|nr:4-hydroxy-3-methylbut-2-enyl diphosphate reductase [Rhodanobacteraceae bacterium]